MRRSGTPGAGVVTTIVRPQGSSGPYACVSTDHERNVVTATFPEHNKAFISTIKRIGGFRWDASSRAWSRRITERDGAPADRAAEVMHALLGAGIPVSCDDEDVRRASIAGSFEPAYPRWISLISRGKMAGTLLVSVDDRAAAGELQRIGRKSYYRDDTWLVRPEHWEVLRDMAEMHAIRITAAADRVMKAAQDADEAALLVTDLPAAPVAIVTEPAQDQSPAGIHPELRDD